MELFGVLSDCLCDKPEMKYLLTADGKAFLRYLADIFEKHIYVYAALLNKVDFQ